MSTVDLLPQWHITHVAFAHHEYARSFSILTPTLIRSRVGDTIIVVVDQGFTKRTFKQLQLQGKIVFPFRKKLDWFIICFIFVMDDLWYVFNETRI